MSDAEESRKQNHQQERERAEPQREQVLQGPILSEAATQVIGRTNHPIYTLQARVGNRAVARSLAARAPTSEYVLPEVGAAGGVVSNRLATRIYQSLGRGATLSPSRQATLEAEFGASLDDVRIHTGAEADMLARQVSARAFTLGRDIFFSQDAGPDDSRLLTHEITHVVQQASAPSPTGGELVVGPADDALEHEAERAASQSAEAAPASASAPQVQRGFWDEMNPGNLAGILGFGGSLVQAGAEMANTPLARLAGTTAGEMTSVPGLTGLGGITSAIGLVTGTQDMLNEDKPWYERIVGGMSAASGATGLAGTAGELLFGTSALSAGGATGLTASAGTALTGGLGLGAAIGSAGAVLGAGAAGYGAGRLLDEGVGALGQWISGDEEGDYTISGGFAGGMTAIDQALTPLWADEDAPAYTQTIGWQLGELLGI